MTFSTLWQSLCRKRPALTDDSAVVEITAANLRKLLEQAYDIGKKNAKEAESFVDDLLRKAGMR